MAPLVSAGTGTKVGLGVAGTVAAAGWLWNTAETRGSIEWAWTFFLRVIHNGPIGLWAVLLAVLAGWLVMLRMSALPFRCLSKEGATQIASWAGALASFSVVGLLWREPLGLIVGALVGLATPYTWSLVLILLELCPGAWAQRWARDLRGEGRQLDLFGRKQ